MATLAVNDSLNYVAEASARVSFGTTDYGFFCAILLISVFIGVYFGFCSKQDSTTEYLLAGKRMGCFPVAMSIIASHVSGITLLGIPTEVYQHGTQYTACIITSVVTCVITAYIFLPVFYKLQLPSTFEYLEIRYSRPVRILSSFLFTISLFMYIPIVVYVPALAFSQVTGLSVHMVTPVLCIVCIIYTSIGGLKAVVWTDTIQFTVTTGALFAVLILGVLSVGGFGEIWNRSEEGGRLIFLDMDPSPLARNTFWGMTVGMTFTWLGHLGIHPGTVQRFLSVPKEATARHAMGLTAIGLIIIKLICVLTGMIMYAKYYNCDPTLTKMVAQVDQTLPHYVMQVAGHVPGLPGLFVAGLMSAALATMSASLNTVSGTVYEDFIDPWIPDSPTKEAKAATIMKCIVLMVGMISVGLVFLVERLGTIFQMAVTLRSVTDGPSFGIFVLGMLVPWSNAKGALLGGCTSLATMFWLVGGRQWHVAHGRLRYSPLPTSIEGCSSPWNETILETARPPLEDDVEPLILFRVSFMYYSMLGSMIAVIVGVIGSYLMGGVDLNEIDPDHITPCMRRFLPKRKYMEVALKESVEITKLTQNEKEAPRQIWQEAKETTDEKKIEATEKNSSPVQPAVPKLTSNGHSLAR